MYCVGGQPRKLNFLLLSLLVKKRIVREALKRFIYTVLAVRAQTLRKRFESLGLGHVLEDAGIEEPEEIIIESDLVSRINNIAASN